MFESVDDADRGDHVPQLAGLGERAAGADPDQRLHAVLVDQLVGVDGGGRHAHAGALDGDLDAVPAAGEAEHAPHRRVAAWRPRGRSPRSTWPAAGRPASGPARRSRPASRRCAYSCAMILPGRPAGDTGRGVANRRSGTLLGGGVSEWPKEHASKACEGASPPRVQIPPPPPNCVATAKSRGRPPAMTSAGAEAGVKEQPGVPFDPDDELLNLAGVVKKQVCSITATANEQARVLRRPQPAGDSSTAAG